MSNLILAIVFDLIACIVIWDCDCLLCYTLCHCATWCHYSSGGLICCMV